MIVDSFISSGCKEYFIRYETSDRQKILGFCRLRLNTEWNPFLKGSNNCAIILS